MFFFKRVGKGKNRIQFCKEEVLIGEREKKWKCVRGEFRIVIVLEDGEGGGVSNEGLWGQGGFPANFLQQIMIIQESCGNANLEVERIS